MCARKAQVKVKKVASKVAPKTISKKVAVCKKGVTLKKGDLPETYVKGFHDLDAVRKMKYSPLGKTGMNVSLLSFGASSLGSVFRETAEEEAVNVLVTAIKKGMNYIDTAAWYGHGKSERVLGLALKKVPRKAYYIATKACRYLPEILETFDFSYERTLKSIDESLERLGLTYVDVIQVHDMEFAPNVEIIVKQTLPAMQRAKELGKVRHIGLTGYPLKIHRDVLARVPKEIQIGTVIIYCHYSMNDTTLLELMPLLKQRGIGLINAAAVSMGLLTNRGPPSWHPAGDRVKKICKKAAEYCDTQNVDISKLAMHFSLHTNKKIPTCLVSTASMVNLEKNLKSVHERLTKKEKEVSAYCMQKFFSKPLSWSGHEVKQFRSDLKAAKAIVKKSYDYIVIGAGSGGIASARRAAQHGADVLLIEQRRVGGTCVNVGCVPKKVMFNLATYLEDSHDVMHHYGVKADVSLDFSHFKKARDNYVLRLNHIYNTNIKASGITYVEGMGKFVGPNRINIDQDHYEAKHILIAAGGEPEAGSFPGADLCMNSNDVFDLETLPESISVIGGGYIGIELAQILHALGVKTTVIIRSIPLRFVDREVVDVLVHSMKQSGMDVRLESPHESVVQEADGSYTVNLQSGQKINSEKVLLAMGRPPSTKGLGLETTGVEIAKSGHVVVDEFQNTNQQGVYAVGDVTVCPALTPVAVRAGRILSERLFNNRTDLKMDYDLVPTTIFSHPPIGTVGLSEENAVKAFGKENVSAYKSSFVNMFYGLMPPDSKSPERPKSMFKLITHHEPEGVERVVGVHGIGRGIDEMMQTTAVAMKMGASKQDFDNTVAIHPTASEELVLMDTKYV